MFLWHHGDAGLHGQGHQADEEGDGQPAPHHPHHLALAIAGQALPPGDLLGVNRFVVAVSRDEVRREIRVVVQANRDPPLLTDLVFPVEEALLQLLDDPLGRHRALGRSLSDQDSELDLETRNHPGATTVADRESSGGRQLDRHTAGKTEVSPGLSPHHGCDDSQQPDASEIQPGARRNVPQSIHESLPLAPRSRVDPHSALHHP